jgi:hypothetical protein
VTVNVCAAAEPAGKVSVGTLDVPPAPIVIVTVAVAGTTPFGLTMNVDGAPVMPLTGPMSAICVALAATVAELLVLVAAPAVFFAVSRTASALPTSPEIGVYVVPNPAGAPLMSHSRVTVGTGVPVTAPGV